MKIKTSKQALLKNIQNVQNIISSKSSLPILSNILIEAEKDIVTLTATNLDLTAISIFEAKVEEAGSTTINAKKFNDIISNLDDKEIIIKTIENNKLSIKCEKSNFKLFTLDKTEFPKIPDFNNEKSIKIKQDVLKKMLLMTSFAISTDETRYVLNGSLFLFNQDEFIIASTDGKRLCEIKTLLENNTINASIIMPLKAINELKRLLTNNDVKISYSENQLKFEMQNITLISRLIEGKFPDYKQIIPAVANEKISIQRKEFLNALKRMSILTTQDSAAIKIEILENKMIISKANQNIGEANEELNIEYNGQDIIIGFNPNYLIEALNNIEKEKIEIEIIAADKPAIIRITENSYTYLALPMQLT